MSNHDYPDTTTFPRVRQCPQCMKGVGTHTHAPAPSAVTERQRISSAVMGLPITTIESESGEPDKWLVGLIAVLKIIDGQP